MKNGFNNPISVKNIKEKKTPFNNPQLTYDTRSSCYINMGSHYGIGHKNPIGHEGNPKESVETLPKGRVNTMRVSEIPTKNLPNEIDS